ncbi:hypothetical protein JR065_16300 [Xanthomonas sp. AmX2]|uniref:hypothetical protein n=1 Tax=Xanthomonas sp. TaxID=29446 RepID=UPI00197D902E|nr:hypothetical protein [Xanthomonas sp.]MBN6151908.1 hypothetical protein [Xanthomonas sp.]
MNENPVWVGEPAWAYHRRQPMVFLQQVLVAPSAQHIKERLSLGDTVYVFGSRHRLKRSPEEKGSDVYRTAVQTFEANAAYGIRE